MGVLAENSLPFKMYPVIIDVAKALTRDPKALGQLSMDRTITSYKMVYGLSSTVKDTVVENMKTGQFSLNIVVTYGLISQSFGSACFLLWQQPE